MFNKDFNEVQKTEAKKMLAILYVLAIVVIAAATGWFATQGSTTIDAKIVLGVFVALGAVIIGTGHMAVKLFKA